MDLPRCHLTTWPMARRSMTRVARVAPNTPSTTSTASSSTPTRTP